MKWPGIHSHLAAGVKGEEETLECNIDIHCEFPHCSLNKVPSNCHILQDELVTL